VDSKTQTYLDDFLVRKKAILKAARAGAAGTTTTEVDAVVEQEFVEANRTEDLRVQAEIKTVMDELIIDGTMAEARPAPRTRCQTHSQCHHHACLLPCPVGAPGG
jgi:hypothetical protein